MKVILITGSEGFVGSYFIKSLKEKLYKIIPTVYPLFVSKVESAVPLDILNLEMTKEVINNYQPDIVFHLAAISSVSKSFRDPPLAYNTNIIGTVNLLEALKSLKKKVRFFFVSSCEVYGGGSHITEKSKISLKNPYAVSKYAGELICQHTMLSQFDWVILRPFTHTGPGQARDFVLPSIAAQIAEIEKGKKPPLIELGNIEVKREFMNVRDVAEAYKLALDKAKPGNIYNISVHKGYTISDALAVFSKISRVKFEIKSSTARMRKVDIPVLIGNGSKFRKVTGWRIKIKFEKTIEELLNYWRAKI